MNKDSAKDTSSKHEEDKFSNIRAQLHVTDVIRSQRQQDPPSHFMEKYPHLFYPSTRTDQQGNRRIEMRLRLPGGSSKETLLLHLDEGEPSRIFQYDVAKPDADKMISLYRTLNTMDNVLRERSTSYMLHGSMAQALHNAYMIKAPDDIDILVENPTRVSHLLLASDSFVEVTQGSSMLAKKVRDTSTGICVQMHQIEHFGMKDVSSLIIHGKSVLSLYNTLESLLLRPNVRDKDMVAFASLVNKYGNELTEKQQSTLASRGHAPNWETLVAHMSKLYSDARTYHK